jgi:hypothetical protein
MRWIEKVLPNTRAWIFGDASCIYGYSQDGQIVPIPYSLPRNEETFIKPLGFVAPQDRDSDE